MNLFWQPSTYLEADFTLYIFQWNLHMHKDIFQRMIDQILDCCKWVTRIIDDIIIHGKDDTEHDRRLHKFMRVTREHGLVLNKKCEVKSNSVKFFGCVYNKHGAHLDPSKVSAIKKMPIPQNKIEHQSFLGMVTYLSTFIPKLYSHTATLRGFLKTNVEYGEMPHIKSHFTKSNHWYVRIQHWGTWTWRN